MKKKLDSRPIRRDLSDREFCRALGGLLGGLAGLGELDQLRNAVCWWAETDEAWDALARTKAAEQEFFGGN